jgi:hypothetical protein
LDGKQVGVTSHTGLKEISRWDETSKSFVPRVIAALAPDLNKKEVYVASPRSEQTKTGFSPIPEIKETFVVRRFSEGAWLTPKTVLEKAEKDEVCTAMAVAANGRFSGSGARHLQAESKRKFERVQVGTRIPGFRNRGDGI